MLQRRHYAFLTAAILGLMLLNGCAVEQNTITSNVFHNLAAHYNGYYYARESNREAEKVILKSLDDDHNEILRLFPKLDTVLAKTYSKDTDEAIKMASISIQRHPNSRWVYDNYIEVGLSRLYASDFVNATTTLKYVNTKSRNPNVRHKALIFLMRTFIEHDEFDRAEETFHFLEKEKLNKTNQKNLYLEKAYFYQLRGDYDRMVGNLAKADSLLSRSDRKGRIYFIIGQVYQKLGFESAAYEYYKKCLATNPDYEIEFYARLNMAQVSKLEGQKDMRTVRRQFNKLLTDNKNIEFRDKIYFEMGEFERKTGNLPEAIDNYKHSAHAGKNKRIQGNAFLRMGQLYFDSLKKYSLAKSYYDSAVSALPKEIDGYGAIKKRQEVLGDFVKYTETITWQDSLLRMASMDSLSLRKMLDSSLEARKKLIPVVKKKKKRGSDDNGPSATASNPFFNQDNGGGAGESEWYFGNSSLVALGQSEFARIWGNIPLEDNWRRSARTVVAAGPATDPSQVSQDPDNPAGIPGKDGPEKKTEKLDEAAKVFSQLPMTDAQKKEANAKIEEAYFKLGDLYYFQLDEKNNAAVNYRSLLKRFPDSKYEPEVLYKMYLIQKEIGGGFEQYADLLKTKHPNSTFTRILINPEYMKESSVAAEKQKLIYKEAYADYQNGNLRGAQEKIAQAEKEGDTGFSQQLELLQILITGKTEDITRYQYALETFIKKHPDGSLKPYAAELLASSKALQERIEKSKGIRYIASFKEPHYFAVVYKLSDNITDQVTKALENFDKTEFRDQKLNVSNLKFSDEYGVSMVTEFTDRDPALAYYEKFSTASATLKPFAFVKFYTFVITKDNFNIFYRTKALDEYLTFFDRNYQAKNP